MATIAVNTILDEGTARTEGETWTINSGAVLTIKTDTRVHAKAPTTTGTGSIGSITINEGEVFIDARDVRWLAYTDGSENVPAIGTIITQGDVSGYMLGVWAGLTSLATAAGSAMPTTGFIKFRQVTGGNFIAGALSGISATASGVDVTGWIEVVADLAANITIPRLGTFTTRGANFYLDSTTGVRGQTIQIPTNGSSTTYVAAVEIETSAGSGVYDKYPALNGATNGWAVSHLGQAKGESDTRQQFVKMLTDGKIQIGEQITQTGTYAYTASQASTYASSTRGGYYWRKNNVVEVFCSGGHYLLDKWQTGFNATSGLATDGVVTANVLNPYWFTFSQVGADTEGTCNCRESVVVTFTAHGLQMGEKVYLTPTTGTLTAGQYEIIGVLNANVYQIKYPHTAALTSGNTGALHTITVTTSAAHGLAIGNRVYADFTTGTAPDGVYTIRTVPTATTYTINCPLSATTSGNITTTHHIGYVPPAGCKVRIPNILMRQCVSTTRNLNAIPDATLATRPEFTTTTAGKVDMEYVSSDWYFSFAQAYSVSLKNCDTFDTIQLSEIATPFLVENCSCGMVQALDIRSLQSTSNFAGGSIIGGVWARGNVPGSGDHSVEIAYCEGITIEGGRYGIAQYARSTGFPLQLFYSNNISTNGVRLYNGPISLASCSQVAIKDTGYCDRYIGYTSATASTSSIAIEFGSTNVMVDGLTFGHGGTIANCHPVTGATRITSRANNVTFRNIGTFAQPLPMGTWQPNLTGLGSLLTTAGNCFDYRVQNCYVESTRGDLITTTNADKGVTIENVLRKNNYQLGTFAINAPVLSNLNTDYKNIGLINETTTNASVYGAHFAHQTSNGIGRLVLRMHEPTVKTAAYFTNVSGRAKFNSSGGILQDTLGSQNIWESSFLIKGVRGFENYEGPVMSGSTQGWYLVEYALNKGSGYSQWRNYSLAKVVASGASASYDIVIADPSGIKVGDYIFGGVNLGYRNKVVAINGTTITLSKPNRGAASGTVYFSQLPNETVSPSGFKIKVRITTTTAATTAITHLRFSTLATHADTIANTYPLDTIKLTLTGLVSGSDIVILNAGTEVERVNVDANPSTTYNYVYEATGNVDIKVYKRGYVPFSIMNYALSSSNASLPVAQVVDRNYIE